MSVWLAVEVGDLVWPKEPALRPRADGTWYAVVSEGGDTPRVDLAMWTADSQGERAINKWLHMCRMAGSYPGMSPVAGMRRLHSVTVELKKS